MEKENAIEVKHISKSFKVYLDRGNTMKEMLLFRNRRRYEERHVIRDISFSVKKGEAVGLIGHNGCGKSTTLKMLTKIMYPDSGTIEMRGRVSSLIELGAGFHPDMSGRENIYINASIFGLTKKEIDDRIGEIIDFSELHDFIDNPVRTYSSGMYTRLAFAVAINIDADILLIDEILAVGDIAFQAKCFNKLREIKGQGTTIVIVSHNLSQIEQICERSIWIHEGLIKEEGKPRIVDPKYTAFMSRRTAENAAKAKAAKEAAENNQADSTEESAKEEKADQNGSREVYIDSIEICDMKGNPRTSFESNEAALIKLNYKAERPINDAVCGIAIYRDDQTYIYGTNTLIDNAEPLSLGLEGTVSLVINDLPLNLGNYTLDFAFHKPDGFNYDYRREAAEIKIVNPVREVGIISLPHQWEVR